MLGALPVFRFEVVGSNLLDVILHSDAFGHPDASCHLITQIRPWWVLHRDASCRGALYRQDAFRELKSLDLLPCASPYCGLPALSADATVHVPDIADSGMDMIAVLGPIFNVHVLAPVDFPEERVQECYGTV
ncbi:hypothetical protein A0H81_03520 [Grifola frondosa]|uniref:Uncharacterized protein n=1 Tax=Grifola frondosa TaxID=5627 RepID=A0A1C7MQB5_GRIFR|nr:hypothetical protein A0H81_03520 [Grifola frondosa]